MTAVTAAAQSAEDILPLTQDPNDPIGIDQEQATLERAAVSGKRTPNKPRDSAAFGPEPPPFAARAGEVLSAVPSVRELSHRVEIEFGAGLAHVVTELAFENSAEKPAELVYRLAVPEDAALAGLEVCLAKNCRSGLPDPRAASGLRAYDDAVQARGPKGSGALPVGDALKQRDARGSAIKLRAAPVSRSQPLRIRVAYLARAPQHDSVVRFVLPARGMDPRAAQLQLALRASELQDLQLDGLAFDPATLRADPWTSLALSGRASATLERVWKLACAQTNCARAYVSAPAQRAAPRDIVLAVDASPSTEGSARSRYLATIAAILARAPQGSRVRALRFASSAAALLPERREPRDLALSVFAPVAFEAELGAATRFEAAWRMIEAWKGRKESLRKLVVILGDGGLTTGPARPFDAARRAGVEVAVVNVADRPSEAALAQGAQLSGGALIDAGAEADAAARGGSPDALEERMAALFQPALGRLRVAGSAASALELRAGDSVSFEGKVSNAVSVQLGARALRPVPVPAAWSGGASAHAAERAGLNDAHGALAAVERADLVRAGSDRPAQDGGCDRRGPAQRQSGISSDAAPVALAEERVACTRPKLAAAPKPDKEAEPGAGMPSSPLLQMLRQRIMPVARGCFRRDRAGRADYQVRAVFEFELADREVVSARVQGKIAEELRACLLEAIDQLAVPRFSGRVVVRYPLVTEREPLPSQIELTAAAARGVDELIAAPAPHP